MQIGFYQINVFFQPKLRSPISCIRKFRLGFCDSLGGIKGHGLRNVSRGFKCCGCIDIARIGNDVLGLFHAFLCFSKYIKGVLIFVRSIYVGVYLDGFLLSCNSHVLCFKRFEI